MVTIDCRLAHIGHEKEMSYGILPTEPGYEMVPKQLYYGQTEWRARPTQWVDQTWRRTATFRRLEEECYLPDPEYLLGETGFVWLIFRFKPRYPISEQIGHRRAPQLKLMRQLALHLTPVTAK